ncbi:GlcG protein [Haematobacter massiliensis]|uniref:GlcG protein n=1 Tax=Haematobacter massiliensis TaxID=195105 RepID=A0A086Y4U7_9RHOB|nr:heme-binding protein [Haematobacter massiliensis]KFI29297.1 GlcG protein [Haematobacter massiliensis]OWJ69894.1 GlcG protein [Haematobacter massiliensis]OWJ82684.1 GlcG protein [Haematobacter massiliensis]QBJ25915.1 heme-binding protein [Haematobacter massiliensis]
MKGLTLERADRLASHALAEGGRRGFAPLAVAVLDAGGNTIVAKRGDGAGHLRIAIAEGKAWGALGLGLNTRDIVALSHQIPQFVAALAATSGGRVLPSPGGLILREGEEVLGAIGLSGDTGDNDEICAHAALEAEGLTPLPARF